VRDLAHTGAFYDATLSSLGWVRLWDSPEGVGYGPPSGGQKLNLFLKPDTHPPGAGFHLAFNAPSRSAVDAFHVAAIATGGLDRGGPGVRERYGPSYYAAFVTDPNGYRLEAVCQSSV
jgi:catechol 2,3-dioxygenase-like lactoylglutathione lyase family enzyme